MLIWFFEQIQKKITFNTVKFISILLVFYVLLLSVQPCCADDNCANDEHSVKTEKSTNSQHHDKDCNGHCSPFFTCGTCAGVIYHSVTFSIEPQAIEFTTLVSIYNPAFVSEFNFSFWQPPKIS